MKKRTKLEHQPHIGRLLTRRGDIAADIDVRYGFPQGVLPILDAVPYAVASDNSTNIVAGQRFQQARRRVGECGGLVIGINKEQRSWHMGRNSAIFMIVAILPQRYANAIICLSENHART